jgi:DNA repair photolyase
MYDIRPPAVYVHADVMASARYRDRVEGVLHALRRPVRPVTFTDDDLPGMLHKGLLSRRWPLQGLGPAEDPALLFNLFRFDDRFEEIRSRLREAGVEQEWGLRPLLGYGAFNWARYNLEGDPHRHDKVCRPCWRIHQQYGCLHRCTYCGFLCGLLVSSVNVEEYCEQLGEIIRRHPWQKTYLLDDDGDPPCLEPEHGVLGKLIEYFGALSDRYLIVHTKTWNTAWLRDLEHNGNTIFVWSLSGPTQSRLIEPRTGTTDQRILAARIAQEAGYTVRYKFKPIVPVKGWRDEAASTVAKLFEMTDPDVISLCVWMWHDVDEMKRRLPTHLLDPVYLKAAEDSRDEMAKTRSRPFPPWVRQEICEHYLKEIRAHNADVPVSLSTESFPMWKEMGPKLGYTAATYDTAATYVCGCGPTSTPGAVELSCHPFRDAVPDREGLLCTY